MIDDKKSGAVLHVNIHRSWQDCGKELQIRESRNLVSLKVQLVGSPMSKRANMADVIKRISFSPAESGSELDTLGANEKLDRLIHGVDNMNLRLNSVAESQNSLLEYVKTMDARLEATNNSVDICRTAVQLVSEDIETLAQGHKVLTDDVSTTNNAIKRSMKDCQNKMTWLERTTL